MYVKHIGVRKIGITSVFLLLIRASDLNYAFMLFKETSIVIG